MPLNELKCVCVGLRWLHDGLLRSIGDEEIHDERY